MRKVLAWRVAGYIAGLLGCMVVGGMLALLTFEVEVPPGSVGFAAGASATLILTAVCLLISASMLEDNRRTSAQKDLADIKVELAENRDQLSEVLAAVHKLRGVVEKQGSDVGVLTRHIRSTAKRLGAAERQLLAARSAEVVLTRAQRQVDKRTAELRGEYDNVHQLR